MILDRFISGWFAGVTGGVVMNIWSFLSYHVLNLTRYRFVDWTGELIYGKPPESLLEIVVAFILNLLFAGILGSILAMILLFLGSDFLLLKGVIISTTFAFCFFTIPTLFQEPQLKQVDVLSVISNYIGATMWGLIVPSLLLWIDKKTALKA